MVLDLKGGYPLQVKAFRKLRKNDPYRKVFFLSRNEDYLKIKVESFAL
jgi:hypothetical protein